MAEHRRKILKFIWKVENYSYCWNQKDDFLKSPDFYLEIFEGSAWCLKLYPRGRFGYENYLSVYLERLSSSEGPLGITIDYEIALLRSNGEIECSREMKDRCFRKGHTFGYDNLVARERLLGAKPTLLPDDILTLQCCVFPKNTELEFYTEVLANTHTKLERFLWQWKDFEYTQRQFITLNSKGDKRNLWINMEFSRQSGSEPAKLHCKFYCDEKFKTFHCRIGVLDSNNSVSKFLVNKFFDINGESSALRHYLSFTLITEPEVLKNKYLVNGKLNLNCEITLCFGIQHSEIEGIARGTNFTFAPLDEGASTCQTDAPQKKLLYNIDRIPSSLKKDFHNLYQEGTLSDFSIKVGNKNFQVHKAVLCARSPVFKAMLTSNMKENAKNMVDISDLEEDTVQRMLTFMYTDTASNLDWETANNLYFAADKYCLIALKRVCSDFLKQNLGITNVGKILALANMFADDDLKENILKFICDHEIKVMCSAEWKTFMLEEAHLAAETMHQIFLKKAGKGQ